MALSGCSALLARAHDGPGESPTHVVLVFNEDMRHTLALRTRVTLVDLLVDLRRTTQPPRCYPAKTTFAGTGLSPAGSTDLFTAHLAHDSAPFQESAQWQP